MTFQRRLILIAALLLPACGLSQTSTARPYYDELYQAGGLDRIADQYVCFDEDLTNQNFFIFATSDALKAAFLEHKQFNSLAVGSKAMFDKGFLYVRLYNKGVPLGDSDDQYMKNGESWLGDPFRFDRVATGRLRLRVSFETLRYRRSVEVTKDRATHEAATTFGKCERVAPGIQQNGK